MSRREFTADVCMSLLAVVIVAAGVLIANWPAITDQPTDTQAAADTAADLQDAIAAARMAALTQRTAK